MKAAILTVCGAPPVVGDFAIPDEAAGARLTVQAAAIKQLDRAIASGGHYASPKALPIVLGTDGVGIDVNGRRQWFWSGARPWGSMAEIAPAAWMVPVPEGVSDALAAAIVNPALGAWLPLFQRGGFQSGEHVLILGATGATGRQAVALARHFGAGRISVAGRRRDVLARLGADLVIDLADETSLADAFGAVAATGVDVIVDYVWGRPAEILISALTRSDLAHASGKETRYVSVGAMAGGAISLPSAALRGARLTLTGSGTATFPPVAEMQHIVGEILHLAAIGVLGLETGCLALEEATEGWGRAWGDLRPVIVMDGQ